MVKQELVQLAMEKIGEPCTTTDIQNYLVDNKLVDSYKWDIKTEISNQLNSLKKWGITARFMHGGNKGAIWYLVINGNTHDCKECELRRNSFKGYMNEHISRSQSRKYKTSNDMLYHDEYTARWGSDT